MMILCKLFIFVMSAITLFKPECWARVDIRHTKKLVLPTDYSQPFWTEKTSQRIFSANITPNDSGNSAASKIMDNTFSYWWETSEVKKTAIGRTADNLDKKLKTEVNLGTSSSNNAKTEHKLSIKLLAMQALAKIEYKGWVRAGLNYDAHAAKTEAQLLENISANNDLVLSHSISATENKSQVSLLWNW